MRGNGDAEIAAQGLPRWGTDWLCTPSRFLWTTARYCYCWGEFENAAAAVDNADVVVIAAAVTAVAVGGTVAAVFAAGVDGSAVVAAVFVAAVADGVVAAAVVDVGAADVANADEGVSERSAKKYQYNYTKSTLKLRGEVIRPQRAQITKSGIKSATN